MQKGCKRRPYCGKSLGVTNKGWRWYKLGNLLSRVVMVKTRNYPYRGNSINFVSKGAMGFTNLWGLLQKTLITWGYGQKSQKVFSKSIVLVDFLARFEKYSTLFIKPWETKIRAELKLRVGNSHIPPYS